MSVRAPAKPSPIRHSATEKSYGILGEDGNATTDDHDQYNTNQNTNAKLNSSVEKKTATSSLRISTTSTATTTVTSGNNTTSGRRRSKLSRLGSEDLYDNDDTNNGVSNYNFNSMDYLDDDDDDDDDDDVDEEAYLNMLLVRDDTEADTEADLSFNDHVGMIERFIAATTPTNASTTTTTKSKKNKTNNNSSEIKLDGDVVDNDDWSKQLQRLRGNDRINASDSYGDCNLDDDDDDDDDDDQDEEATKRIRNTNTNNNNGNTTNNNTVATGTNVDVVKTKKGILGIGKNTLKSLNQTRKGSKLGGVGGTTNNTSGEPRTPKDGNAATGGNSTASGENNNSMDPSWRASFGRGDRKNKTKQYQQQQQQQQPIVVQGQQLPLSSSHHSVNAASSSKHGPVAVASRAISPTQQELQTNNQSGNNNSNSSITTNQQQQQQQQAPPTTGILKRYMRSWGRDKALLQEPVAGNEASLPPPPPSLTTVSRTNSGPLVGLATPPALKRSFTAGGGGAVMVLGQQASHSQLLQTTEPTHENRNVVSGTKSTTGKQRSKSTSSMRLSGKDATTSPSFQDILSGTSSPPTSSQQHPQPPPTSPHDRQRSLKQQLMYQIKQQMRGKSQFLSFGELSPKAAGGRNVSSSNQNNETDFFLDDNESDIDVGYDPQENLDEDDHEDQDDDGSSTNGGWDGSDDDTDGNTSYVYNRRSGHHFHNPNFLNWNSMPALPNRYCRSAVVPTTQHPTSSTVSSPISGTVGGIDSFSASVAPASATAAPAAPPSQPPQRYGPPHYLDAEALTTKVTRLEANEFVSEHGVLLQAVLQLLAERDQVGVEGSMDSSDNIWKKGPLRILSNAPLRRISTSHKTKRPVAGGVWKVRYVELRHGNLCYYEDSGTETVRKTIHLRQTDTVIKDSLYCENKRGQLPPGYIFEVQVQGSATSIWMASSEEERQSWVRAIKSAMIGLEDSTTNNTPRKTLDMTPYQESLRVYMKLRDSLQLATNHKMYVSAIHDAMKEVASLQVPVQWVREQIEQELSPLLLGTMKPPKFNMSPQKALKSSITEFWKNMKQTTFSINGLTVPRHSHLSSERVVGALTRAILEFDKAFIETNKTTTAAAAISSTDGGTVTTTTTGVEDPTKSQISELQAVSYARSILMAVLRSRERQDTACAAKYLLENPSLVVLDKNPSHSTMMHHHGNPHHHHHNFDDLVYIEVSFAGEDLMDDSVPDSEEMAGWVWTRTRRRHQTPIAVPSSTRKATYTFAVLSGTLLSYYAAANPRPHGLRGQFALSNTSTVRYEGPEYVQESSSSNTNNATTTATSTTTNPIGSTPPTNTRYVLCISTPGHQDRLLSLEDEEQVSQWQEAIETAIESAGSWENNPPRVVTTTTTTQRATALPGKMLAMGAERAIMVAGAGTKQGIRAIKGAKDIGIRAIKTSTDGGIKVIRGAVGMLLPNNQAGRLLKKNLLPKRPSMQMLLNDTINVHGRREPTVQCVIQSMQTFLIRDPNSSEHTDDDPTSEHNAADGDNTTRSTRKKKSSYQEYGGWMTIKAKIYQAFLMSGGPSGRIARGVALVELDFVETNIEEEDDYEEDDEDDMIANGDEEDDTDPTIVEVTPSNSTTT